MVVFRNARFLCRRGATGTDITAQHANLDTGIFMETLYDSKGNAVAYLHDDGESIYTFKGQPVAWLSGDHVYSYSGKYLGWYQSGWVYDRSGRPALFTSGASSGPAKPARMARPARNARSARPARAARQARPARPARSTSWSALSGVEFFNS